MGAHLIGGEFQSDKYPTTPPGKVPLSVKDPTAQDLLWEYAQRRRVVDAEFSEDLEAALLSAGFKPGANVCAYREDFDPVTLAPRCGQQCGKPAVKELHWRDGRTSLSCENHGRAILTPEARGLLRSERKLKVSKQGGA